MSRIRRENSAETGRERLGRRAAARDGKAEGVANSCIQHGHAIRRYLREIGNPEACEGCEGMVARWSAIAPRAFLREGEVGAEQIFF